MAGKYSIQAINNSTQQGSICLYQTNPNAEVANLWSLAWFASVVPPNTEVTFSWTHAYSFVWAETALRPGVIFEAAQLIEADLANGNQIDFTSSGGQYTFTNQTAGPSAGSLYIREDATIPMNEVAVGMGMSGSGIFAAQAQPNTNLVIPSYSQYWIAFGSFARGEVLDPNAIVRKAQVVFPTGLASCAATYGADGSWTISRRQR